MSTTGKTKPIVRSLLENDLYKFTMWQALLHSNPGARAEYTFVCRNIPVFPLASLKGAIEKELDHLCTLQFSADELIFLRNLRFLKSDFVDFLTLFRFQRHFIEVGTEGDRLTIKTSGPLVHVMGFEIYVLYIVNELYFRQLSSSDSRLLDEGRSRLNEKIELLLSFHDELSHDKRFIFSFFDFGLRRRYSALWQEEVISALKQRVPMFFNGTSNVYLAKKFGLTPIGTMAHEYLQAYQSFHFRLRDFQKAALEGWVQEYRGDLGIALTDVVGMDAFLADFDLYFAKLFDGLRHDSGDPIGWGEKAIAHYEKLRIDPRTKRLVFSDNLSITQALEIYRHFKGRITTAFGIGTHLTNDIPLTPLNIVMKITACNEQSVAKLPDSPGKILCDNETFLAYLRQVFNQS